MAVAAIIPKLGNTVESCVIVEWKRAVGEPVTEGQALVDVETDKAVMEVTSPATGVVLAQFFAPGDLVPVLETIAVIGQAGEDISALVPGGAVDKEESRQVDREEGRQVDKAEGGQVDKEEGEGEPRLAAEAAAAPISPRARQLAARRGLEPAGLTGSGPGGRIIERDVLAALASRPKLSPVAQAKVAEGGFVAPEKGSGPGGRVMTRDLRPIEAAEGRQVDKQAREATPAQADELVEVVKLTGIRKVIAERMLASLQTTAQLTLNASADARALQAFRQRLKASPVALGLQQITINDLILFAVARTLPQHPDLNAHFSGDTLTRRPAVHLGVAVDTPRGLVVPVIHHAQQLSLKQISQEAKRLAAASLERRVTPDELAGGTFTVTNLGSLGIESFTPVLNPPEVAILGVGNIQLKPVLVDDQVQFIPHLGLSLTINHQVVDGAPGARFLQALAQALAAIDLLVAG